MRRARDDERRTTNDERRESDYPIELGEKRRDDRRGEDSI